MAKKISVIIPNFNGHNLLLENLPKVLETCKKCEIIIVDDKSTDNSVQEIKTKFPRVKILENKKNSGFAFSVNRGIKNAKGDLVLLLNSDVSPRKGFLEPALEYFKSDKKVFAVALTDYSHENGKIVKRGKGKAKFKKGFLNHFAAKIEKGQTLWVSGGSGLFDKEKLIKIGLFDTAFAPFYWEDIDLSYRARKKGFIIFFEPDSKVDHFHEEGAIKKTYTSSIIKRSAYKNQFLFVWKNISDTSLIINHIIWFPYHILKSLLKLDVDFFIGFFWALSKLPKIMTNFQDTQISDKLSDKEILKQFE